MAVYMDELVESSGESQVVGETRGIRGLDTQMESLAAMVRQESEHYPPVGDYLELLRNFPSSEPDPVSENWRRQLCEWCYDVSDHFHFDREVVSIALNYLDRTVALYTISPEGPLPKRKYQLLAVTSLYLAIKLHGEVDTADGVRRKLKIDAFYQLSRNQFDVETIEETERYILTGLKWNVNPPTALRFIAAYLALCPLWCECSGILSSIFDVARYLTELSVCQSDFAFNCHTSAVAFASVLCAVEAIRSTSPVPREVLAVLLENVAEVTGYTYNDPSIITIKSMLKQLCPTMFEAADQAEMEHINGSASKEDPDPDSNLMSYEGGKNSPVCVVEDSSPTRKRGRNL